MHDTEGITTTYFDLALGEDEDAEDEFADYDLVPEGRGVEEEVFGKRVTIIRSIPSAITPLA